MSLVLQSSGGGQITIQEPATASNFTQTLPAGTGTTVVNGVNGSIVSGTAVASTSGTSIDFTSIPSWAKRVTVIFANVSTNSTSNLICRIGNGSIVSSGYASGAARLGSSGAVSTSTAGYLLTADNGASLSYQGQIVISNISGNSWVASSILVRSDDGFTNIGSGSLTLGGVLDRVRITTVNGTDAFDAGTINILYE